MEVRFTTPSYPKLALCAALWSAMALVPLSGLIVIRVEGPRAAEQAVPHRLFDEYPDVRRDLLADPAGARSAIWVSFRHLPAAKAEAAVAAFQRSPGFAHTAPGLYRVDCRGEAAREFRAAAEGYPYAVAPGPRVEAALAADYHAVADRSPFAVAVVRGDWLAAAAADRPALAVALGMRATPTARDEYLGEPLDPAAAFFGQPEALEPAAFGPTLHRRDLERRTGGVSLFARWAARAGFGVPIL